MSVAIEEMLHMALSSNLKQAVAGMRMLNGRSPETWPAELPGHEPSLKINTSRLSMKQLETFLNIEKPMKPKQKDKLLLKAYIPYPTIGWTLQKNPTLLEKQYKN